MQAATSPYLLWVVPLLVENRLSSLADRVLVVDVPKETQIERTMLRDKVSRDMLNIFLPPRPRASSAWPSRTMLLKTLARRMQWHRMLPACTKSI